MFKNFALLRKLKWTSTCQNDSKKRFSAVYTTSIFSRSVLDPKEQVHVWMHSVVSQITWDKKLRTKDLDKLVIWPWKKRLIRWVIQYCWTNYFNTDLRVLLTSLVATTWAMNGNLCKSLEIKKVHLPIQQQFLNDLFLRCFVPCFHQRFGKMCIK